MVRKGATVLGDFERTIRDEPYHYIYRTKIWVVRGDVAADDVIAWLRQRYVKSRAGHRYRVVTYKTERGKYVDYVLLETLNDQDATEFALRWGLSRMKVKRGDRVKRKKLSPQQRKDLDARIEAVQKDFYRAIGWA